MSTSDFWFQPDLSRAFSIPARWYTDPAMLESEKTRIFGHTWQALGHSADVAEPGSYLAGNIAGEPVLVTRTKEGALRGFSNVCRHRGAVLAEGSGEAASIKCPYHAWTYGLDGKLLGQPEFEGVLEWDRSQVCLPPFRAETWGPFVFVNQDLAAPPLAEVLGAIPEEIARIGCKIDSLRFCRRRDYVIECNWKVYIDNYLEGYHLPAAHPGLFRELDYQNYRVETFRYYSSQIAPIRPRQEEGEQRRYEFSGSDRSALYYWLFPNFTLNVYPDNLSSNLIVPLGPDRTLTVFEWFTPSGEVEQATVDFSDEIQKEDIRICESVQRGLRSQHYNQGRFSVKRENGVHHFHGLLSEFLS
jgi:phenylpropionate dioxygenase-like ring-hydroxylating dioxygenase large terminal subunit